MNVQVKKSLSNSSGIRSLSSVGKICALYTAFVSSYEFQNYFMVVSVLVITFCCAWYKKYFTNCCKTYITAIGISLNYIYFVYVSIVLYMG